MKVEAIQGQTLLLNVRRGLIGIGSLGVVLYAVGVSGSIAFLAVAAFLAFLGLTNFGRQCPLLLFLRNRFHRP
jgi:hypothetical protein